MFRKMFFIIGLTVLSASSASSASLQVSPVLLDVATKGDAATSITLRNPSNAALTAQVRVYRWRQADGRDVLEETNDVAASPPAVQLKPDANYTVRIVRLTRKPVVGEESYRLLVDEIPDERQLKGGAVNLVVRQSIPVFFRSPEASPPAVSWTARNASGRVSLHATNSGDRRVRISRLKAVDAGGASANFGDGLVGYVLGRSSASWTARTSAGAFQKPGGKVTALTDVGPIDAALRSN